MVTGAAPEVGTTANRYEVLAKLATGGMADIFLARTTSGVGVERFVVLKRVHKHRTADIEFVHMFLDEARLAAQLQHPNIAQVHDTGKLGECYFFTMEYVHGETVREILHRAYEHHSAIPIACVLALIAGAAAGLQHAHDRVGRDGTPLGIVHRDVSPSNLMVSYDGHVKIVDFGVAKTTESSVETRSGTVKGKMGYMAPEQCRGGQVDRRCDLFSLGIVMWELLVGERLFKRATDFECMQATVDDAAPAPSSLRPEVPPAIDAVVLKLLAKAPADRFQTADELIVALEDAATRTQIGLSVGAVRRYIRELFGSPAEPWIELRRSGASEDTVTVTGAPISSELAKLEAESDELDRLRDLSAGAKDSMPIRATSVPASMPAASGLDPSAAARADSAAFAVAPARRRWWLVGAVAVVGAALAGGALALLPTDAPPARSDRLAAAPVADASGSGASAPPVDASAVASDDGDAGLASGTGDGREGGAGDEVATVDAGTAEPAPSVAELARAKRHQDVVTACLTTAPTTVDATHCTLAACELRDAEAAREFVAQLSGRTRRKAVSRCAARGIKLARRSDSAVVRGGAKVKPPGDAKKPPGDAKKPPGDAKKPPGAGSGTSGCDSSDPMACRR